MSKLKASLAWLDHIELHPKGHLTQAAITKALRAQLAAALDDQGFARPILNVASM